MTETRSLPPIFGVRKIADGRWITLARSEEPYSRSLALPSCEPASDNQCRRDQPDLAGPDQNAAKFERFAPLRHLANRPAAVNRFASDKPLKSLRLANLANLEDLFGKIGWRRTTQIRTVGNPGERAQYTVRFF